MKRFLMRKRWIAGVDGRKIRKPAKQRARSSILGIHQPPGAESKIRSVRSHSIRHWVEDRREMIVWRRESLVRAGASSMRCVICC
jgi:hypothetical protein